MDQMEWTGWVYGCRTLYLSTGFCGISLGVQSDWLHDSRDGTEMQGTL